MLQVEGAELARGLYDIMSHIPPEPEEGDDTQQMQPWCGAAAAAAAGGSESSAQRRKRRKLQVGCPLHLWRCEALPCPSICRVSERDRFCIISKLLSNRCELCPLMSFQTEDKDGVLDESGSKQKPVKWANAVLQRRAWSNAWLALLHLPLPKDILRKASFTVHIADNIISEWQQLQARTLEVFLHPSRDIRFLE